MLWMVLLVYVCVELVWRGKLGVWVVEVVVLDVEGCDLCGVIDGDECCCYVGELCFVECE